MPLLRQEADDAHDVGDEAHVEHAISFIKDQNFDLIQREIFLLKVVEQATGRGNQNLDASAHSGFLLLDVHAAENDGRANAGVFGVGFDGFLNLDRQLARGGEHERADRVACGRRGAVGVLNDPVEDRQRESGGFAGAGLRAAHHVEAGEHDRNRLRLNRRGLGVARFGDRTQDGFREVELRERDVGWHSGVDLHDGGGREHGFRGFSGHSEFGERGNCSEGFGGGWSIGCSG